MVSDTVIDKGGGFWLMLTVEARARQLYIDRSNAHSVNVIDRRTGADVNTPGLGMAGPMGSGLLPTHRSHTSRAGRA